MIVTYYDDMRAAPAPLDVSWPELVELLTTFGDPRCDAATCAGRDCPAKFGPAWSPAETHEWRAEDNVVGVSLVVLDLDHLADLAPVLAAVEGYRYVLHSTHSHSPPDGAYRLVLPLSRVATPAEFSRVRAAVVDALALPADPRCGDLSRLYFLPTARRGAPSVARVADGAPVDVDEALALWQPAVTSSGPPAPAPTDLAALRARLGEVRRAKARGDDRERGHSELLRRVLDGAPLAEPGARDDGILRACGLMAYWLPAETPVEAVVELMRPCVVAMAHEKGVDHCLGVVREKFARQLRSRAAADERRAADDAALRELVRRVAGESTATATAAAGDDWEKLLILDDKGRPRSCEYNAQLLLARVPELAGTVSWDDVAKRVVVRGGPLDGVPEEVLDVACAAWLQRHRDFFAGRQLVGAALLQVALANARDPLAEHLRELAWDGVARVDEFFVRYAGAADTPYARAVSRRWLTALAARALAPGCKVDNVLVLEGAQGIGKSSLLAALVGQEYFVDTALEIGEKDSMQLVSGAWLVELGELSSLKRAETTRVNQFVTSRVDKFRPPYGRAVVSAPRRCLFAGTTNEHDYLRDRTNDGGRRWWPVLVAAPDVAGVARDRDQLLAEAVALYLSGERWWLVGDEARDAAREASDRLEGSSVEEAVERWWFGEDPARRPRSVTLLDVAELALRVDVSRVDGKVRSEVGHAMSRLGFKYVMRRDGGERARRYEPTAELLSAPRRAPGAKAAAALRLVEAARAGAR